MSPALFAAAAAACLLGASGARALDCTLGELSADGRPRTILVTQPDPPEDPPGTLTLSLYADFAGDPDDAVFKAYRENWARDTHYWTQTRYAAHHIRCLRRDGRFALAGLVSRRDRLSAVFRDRRNGLRLHIEASDQVCARERPGVAQRGRCVLIRVAPPAPRRP